MLGARCHYAVPRLLHDAGVLDRLFTDTYIGNKPWLEYLLRSAPDRLTPGAVRRWLGRKDPQLPPERVTSFDWLGLRAALSLHMARSDDDRERTFSETGGRFAKSVVRHGLGSADTVWGFNTASLELFQAAKGQGLRCILEQTILPRKLERQLLAEVGADWPGWQPGFEQWLGQGLLAEREQEEWNLSDQIVAGSEFVARGLVGCGVPEAKIRVIRYGVDCARFAPPARKISQGGPLRVLFVGEVGLRKGAPYLLEALRRLGPSQVEARFAGQVALDSAQLGPYAEVASFLGPVPRTEMPELFRWAQVFSLPSIVEGSAVSSYEALLSGLPLVVTPNAGTIICGDDAGQIVEPRDTVAIEQALRRYCEEPELLARHREGALSFRKMASTERYGRDLAEFARQLSK